jgi:hypothetical protein
VRGPILESRATLPKLTSSRACTVQSSRTWTESDSWCRALEQNGWFSPSQHISDSISHVVAGEDLLRSRSVEARSAVSNEDAGALLAAPWQNLQGLEADRCSSIRGIAVDRTRQHYRDSLVRSPAM